MFWYYTAYTKREFNGDILAKQIERNGSEKIESLAFRSSNPCTCVATFLLGLWPCPITLFLPTGVYPTVRANTISTLRSQAPPD